MRRRFYATVSGPVPQHLEPLHVRDRRVETLCLHVATALARQGLRAADPLGVSVLLHGVLLALRVVWVRPRLGPHFAANCHSQSETTSGRQPRCQITRAPTVHHNQTRQLSLTTTAKSEAKPISYNQRRPSDTYMSNSMIQFAPVNRRGSWHHA